MVHLRWLAAVPMLVSMVACSSSSSDEEPAPKFKETIHPLLAESCSLAACHGSKDSNLGIYIPGNPDDMHTALLKESPTARGAKFVVPGDPDASYLVMKIDGTQSQLATQCSGNCGAQMPLDLPVLSQSDIAALRAWIQAGAKND